MTMSISPAITASKSTLMHASLAHLSQELRTMDNIIHNSRTPSTSRNILPAEIILLIRECLFLTITTQLIEQSTVALEEYEQSLVELLCPDCITYNLDIYGPDIWQWAQFSGACACSPQGAEDPHGHRTSSTGGIRHYYNHNSKTTPGKANPKQFADPEHWLESYLSGEALRAGIGHRGHLQSASSATQPLAPLSVDIWDIVTFVLQEFNCEATREPEDKLRVGRGLFYSKRDFVQVIPSLEREWSDPSPERTQEELDWRAQVTLHRASRDLGLKLDETEAFSTRKRRVPVFTRPLRWPSVSNSCYNGQDIIDIVDTLLRALASLAAACLSLPITFTTIALTILCFYSRPRSLRIL